MASPLLLLLAFASVATSYNIAIFVPYMANSQVMFNARVAETLTNAGHSVSLFVLALYEMDFQKVDVAPAVDYHFVNVSVGFDGEEMMHAHSQIVFENIPFWDARQRKVLSQMFGMVNACDRLIGNSSFVEYIKDQKFDVAFAYMHAFCPLGLIHAAGEERGRGGRGTGIPSWIWLNTGTLADYVADVSGVPLPASYCTPTMMDAGDSLSFVERVKSVVGWQIFRLIWPRVFANRETAMFRRHFGPSFPHLIDLAKRTPLVMVNSHELYDFARPTLAKIVNIGGLGLSADKAQPLQGMYKNLTDAATDGIVVMSFGSIAPMFLMPHKWKQAFAYAFSLFPNVQFFLRYEKKDLDGLLPSNVFISKWLPQTDLLQHPKARGLITHGGYNSFQDAVHSGVPLMAIPLFFDQPRNAHLAEKLGFGVHVRKEEVSRDSVVAALRKILTDPGMLRSARRMRSMVEKRPVAPETLLVKWTEFVAEFQTLDQLTPPGVFLSFIQYHLLDVYLFLFFVSVVGSFIFWRLGRLFLRYVFTVDSPLKEKSS